MDSSLHRKFEYFMYDNSAYDTFWGVCYSNDMLSATGHIVYILTRYYEGDDV